MEKKIIVRDNSGFNRNPLSADNIEFIRKLYWTRGEKTENIKPYSLASLLSPELMLGIPEAMICLFDALKNQKRMLIVGDFDADGATSTALLYRGLRDFGFRTVDFLVPNRFEYGYGLTPEIVNLALESTPDVIITVDNGISSIEGVKKAKEAGVTVIVTDHHLPGREKPIADAIVNPNQHGCTFPSKNLAGVGVTFYVLLAFRKYLREQNWYSDHGITESNLLQWIDIVALGTVADVVPLDFNNRTLIARGIERIKRGQCCEGIKAIVGVAGKELDSLAATDMGFVVGPRLNAAGRLDDMSIGIRCLLTNDPVQAAEYANKLNELNISRKEIETDMQSEADVQLDDMDLLGTDASGVCLFNKEWHQGVIGILASRVKDKMYRPTIVFAEAKEGEVKGSGRSIPGIHLRDVLDEIATQNPTLLSKFGGHAMAAGLTLRTKDLPEFSKLFDACISKQLTIDMRSPIILSDGELKPREITLDLADRLRAAGPWGQCFPEPVFHGEFYIASQKIVGLKHLKLELEHPDNAGEGVTYDAIAFNVNMGTWYENNTVTKVLVAYKVGVNEFRGRRTMQFMVEYLKPIN